MSSRTRRPAGTGESTPAGPVTAAPIPQLDAGNAAANEAAKSEGGGLGSKVEGFLEGLIDDHLSADDIDGYARDGIRGGAGSLGDKAIEVASPEDRAAAEAFKQHLQGDVSTSLGDRFAGTGIGEGIHDLAADHPWAVGGLGAAAVAGYVLSDQKLDDIDTKIKLGGGSSVLLGGDFGTTLHPGVDAVRAGYQWDRGGQQAFMKGEQRFDADEWSLAAGYRQQADWGNLSLDAAHHHQGQRDLTTAGLKFQNESLAAHLNGSWDRTPDKELGAVSGGIRTLGEGPVWDAGFEANTDGRWKVEGGVSHQDEKRQMEWFARAHAGQNEMGQADYGARAGFKLRF